MSAARVAVKEKKMYAEARMSAGTLKKAMAKMVRSSPHREMAKWAVAGWGTSIRQACSDFTIIQAGYRYQPRLADGNERIADGLSGCRQRLALAGGNRLAGLVVQSVLTGCGVDQHIEGLAGGVKKCESDISEKSSSASWAPWSSRATVVYGRVPEGKATSLREFTPQTSFASHSLAWLPAL